MKQNSKTFTALDSEVAKGIAVMLLLIHHLFYAENLPLTSFIVNGTPLYIYIGYFAKVCVLIFTIISGYGLQQSTPSGISLDVFYVKRYSKLYLNFWPVFLIFIPVGVLFFNFGAHMKEFYNGDYSLIIRDFFGISHMWGAYGVNPTWWYMSSIITLYLFFPFFKGWMDKYPTATLIIGFFTLFINVTPLIISRGFSLFSTVTWLLFPFILGMFLAKTNVLYRLRELGHKKPVYRIIKILLYLFLLVFLAYWRKKGLILNDVRIDGFFGFIIILIVYEATYIMKFLIKPLAFLGKHSMNIFLFHTFIYGYFLKDFIYSLRYPPLVFLFLLILCLLISILIEKLKELTGIQKLSFSLSKTYEAKREYILKK